MGSVTLFPVPTASAEPTNITAGPDGNLWFTELTGNKIGRVTPAGVITEFGGVTAPYDIVAGADGNLWFTQQGSSNSVRSISTAGVLGACTAFLGVFPNDIALGADGNLWVTESTANKVARVSTDCSITTFTLPTSSATPTGIAAGRDGNLWFTENTADAVGRITTSGAITEFTIPGSSMPSEMTAGPDGDLWFTQCAPVPGVGQVTIAGSITLHTFSPISPCPAGIAAGADRRVWFTEWALGGRNEIDVIETDGVCCDSFSLETGGKATAIASGPDAQLWFTEQSTDKIGRITDEPRPIATLTPNTGSPGTLVHVRASYFGAFEPVTVAFEDSVNGETILATVTADVTGSLRLKVRVPSSATTGSQLIRLTGQVSGLIVGRPFTVS